MSTALIAFDDREVALIKKTIAPGTTDDQLALFIQVCSQTGLNPFARQIYAVVRNEKQRDGSWEPKMTIQTSIDGYRLLAQRSNEYAGQDGPYWYDGKKQAWTDVWVESYAPAAARVGVLRKGFQNYLYAVARFESYVARKSNGEPQNLWGKMPEVMIAKVAEALALRRAFPAELSGIYTKEEMDQADTPMPSFTPTPAPQPVPQPQQPQSTTENVVESAPVVNEETRERLNNIAIQGKEKHLFSTKAGLAQFASETLEREVLASQLVTLTADDLYRVELAVSANAGLNGAA